MTTHEIRQKFIDFYLKRGHIQIPSASLIPANDPTTLFNGSGMQSLMPYLLGAPHPQGTKLVNSQKCFRSQDIEEVGDNRHTTFFEMLGNWSLGDYFKSEQIEWVWTFLTDPNEGLGLDPNKLYVTVYAGNDEIGIPEDTEAIAKWQEMYAKVGIDAQVVRDAETKGLQGGRIFTYGDSKNWWSRSGVPAQMPAGEPGGPDSEIFYDFGEQYSVDGDVVHVNADGERFLEIGNSVFMMYQKKGKGKSQKGKNEDGSIDSEDAFAPLPNKNIDFGGGLERMALALTGQPDVFKIDIFEGLRTKLEESSGFTYGSDPAHTQAFRVIMDHLRAATFLIGDGVHPGNKDQEYVVRRLIRRAIRFGYGLGIESDFCVQCAEAVIATYAEAYPELRQKNADILQALQAEEEKFRKTLTHGLSEFARMTANAKELTGEESFLLFQSYGFPYEMTEELAREKNITLSREAFDQEMAKHQELSRSASGGQFKGGLADHSAETTRLHTATHLLLASLRKVLGDDSIEQKGSNITAERLRFDFNYPEKLTPEQLTAVEEMVNEQIQKDLTVTQHTMPYEEALAKGAIGIYEGQPGQDVSVYEVVGFSLELCGGPHVTHTGELGHFKIVKEESSSAGVRRIKATLS